jgi:hypothetical protein
MSATGECGWERRSKSLARERQQFGLQAVQVVPDESFGSGTRDAVLGSIAVSGTKPILVGEVLLYVL